MNTYIMKNCRAFDCHDKIINGNKWNFVGWVQITEKVFSRFQFDADPQDAGTIANNMGAEFIAPARALGLGLIGKDAA